MSNKKIIILIIVSVALLGLAIRYLPFRPSTVEPTVEEQQDKVEEYIRENISTLSKHPAVLGGNFYVTNVSFEGTDWGYVEFEDGHIAFRYRFIYGFEPGGTVKIISFDIQDDLNAVVLNNISAI